MKIDKKVLIIIGITLALVNAISFIVPFPHSGAFWAAYVFADIACLAQLGFAYLAGRGDGSMKSKFLGFPLIKTGLLYLGIQLGVTLIIYLIGFAVEVPAWIAVLLGVIILAFAGFSAIGVEVVREEIVKQERQTIVVDTSWHRDFTNKLSMVMIDAPTEISAELATLKEKLRYSDPVSCAALSEIQEKLSAMLDALSANIAAATKDDVAKIISTLDVRNQICKANKQ